MLICAGALAVHELRFIVGFGDHAERIAGEQGHAYLALVMPVVAFVGFVGLVALVVRGVRAPDPDPLAPGVRRVWAVASALLVLIYVGQETLESWTSAGHPGGLAGVFGHGGWSAVIFAVALGALIALAFRGAAQPVAAGGEALWRPGVAQTVRIVSPPGAPALPRSPVERFLAGRGPPRVS